MRLALRTLIMIALAIDAVRTTNALLLTTVAVRAAAAASSCTGKSANLSAADCGAWTDLWDATNGPGWTLPYPAAALRSATNRECKS